MRKSNAKASIKLGEIKKVQKWLSSLIIGESHHQSKAQITYLNNVEVVERMPALTQALQNVKFHWKILVGVLSRTSQGQHHIYTKEFYNHKHETLTGLYPEICDELKSMMAQETNKNYHLTTFFVASPNPDMPTYQLMATGFLLLHKHRVPDLMASNYEFDVKGVDKVPTSYCNSTYWFTDAIWERLTPEIIALEAFGDVEKTPVVEQYFDDYIQQIELNDELSIKQKLITKFKKTTQ